jgi:hypothetical protein
MRRCQKEFAGRAMVPATGMAPGVAMGVIMDVPSHAAGANGDHRTGFWRRFDRQAKTRAAQSVRSQTYCATLHPNISAVLQIRVQNMQLLQCTTQLRRNATFVHSGARTYEMPETIFSSTHEGKLP